MRSTVRRRIKESINSLSSAKRMRTKLSFEVFSSSRRTRYAIPGTSSPPVHTHVAASRTYESPRASVGHAVEHLHFELVLREAFEPRAYEMAYASERKLWEAKAGANLAVMIDQEAARIVHSSRRFLLSLKTG